MENKDLITISDKYVIRNLIGEFIIPYDSIISFAKEVHNNAVDLCKMTAVVERTDINHDYYNGKVGYVVDKQSILKNKVEL